MPNLPIFQDAFPGLKPIPGLSRTSGNPAICLNYFNAIFGLFRIRETSLHGLHFKERLLQAQFIENIVPQNKHVYFECKNKSETHKTPNSLFLIFHQSLEC